MTTITLSQQALDELVMRLKLEIRIIVQQELRDALRIHTVNEDFSSPRPTLELPTLNIGPWPESLGELRREDFYSDDGR